MCAVETITRIAKELVRAGAGTGKKQLYNVLFSNIKNTYNAGFQLDRYVGTPTSMRVIKNGEASVVRQFTPGKGETFTPEINSEKTPIDQSLIDAVLAGFESTSNHDQIAEIIKELLYNETGFVAANNMQRNKAAIDYFRTGKFKLFDTAGSSTGHELDFGRDGALTDTYNFGGAGATMDLALTQALVALEAFGFPRSNVGCIMGKSWLNDFEADAAVLSKLTAYQGAFINLAPQEYMGVDGLTVIGSYKPSGSMTNITIMAYQPQWLYKINSSAATAFLGDTEMIMFDMSALRTQINCGIPVIDEATQKIKTVVGDLIITSDVQKDPAAEYLIAKSRYAFTGFVNHTYICTGSGF